MASESPAAARPTTVRYLVLTLTVLAAVLLYLDRFCLSFAERYIKEDLGLSNEQMSYVLSSFFWAYALAQLPGGWLSDRFGARLMLALYLALWSAVTGLVAFVAGFASLVLLRLAFGLFQAGAYPASAGLVGKWIPFHRRGFASGLVSVGGRIGGALAPILTAYLMVAFVPVSSSSLFGPDDVLQTRPLFDIVFYSPQLPGPEPRILLSGKVLASLPADVSNQLHANPKLIIDPSPEFRALVADKLNGLLGQEKLLDGIDLSDFDLPGEAVRLLKPSPSPRTLEEIQRRNRLVLEAAFPEALRKVYGSGWRPVMLVYGIVGLVFACIFWAFFRDGPRLHPGCNAAEIALIEGAAGPIDPKVRQPLPFVCMLQSPSLWLSSAVQFLTNFGWVFLVTWFPRYLAEVHKVPVVERGWMASIPIMVGMIGMFSGGLLTDYMAVRLGPKWGRSAPVALSRFLVAIAFGLCVFLQTPWQVTVALAMVAICVDLGTPALWAFSLDVGGKHVGSVLGWSNMWGNLGAAISTIALNIIQEQSSWNGVFVACASAFALAGVLALFIDATKPIVQVPRPQEPRT